METGLRERIATQTAEAVRIGVYVCQCGLNIGQTVDCKQVTKKALKTGDVLVSKESPMPVPNRGKWKSEKILRRTILTGWLLPHVPQDFTNPPSEI